MGGLHRGRAAPRGTSFLPGGAGSPRSGQHGRLEGGCRPQLTCFRQVRIKAGLGSGARGREKFWPQILPTAATRSVRGSTLQEQGLFSRGVIVRRPPVPDERARDRRNLATFGRTLFAVLRLFYRTAMGFRRLITLSDVARQGYWVRLQCECGHETKHNPLVLFELVSRRGGSTHLAKLHETMKCGRCGGKDFHAEHCQGPEIWSG